MSRTLAIAQEALEAQGKVPESAWTTERPAKPGRYWYRKMGKVSLALIRIIAGYEDIEFWQANLMHEDGTTSFGSMVIICSDGAWHGPLTPEEQR